MFRLADPEQSYRRVVQVQVPGAEGKTETMSFTAYLKLLSNERVRELASEGDQALIKAVMTGWEEIEDCAGRPFACSDGALGHLCGIGYWTRAVVLDYFEFAAGLPAKN